MQNCVLNRSFIQKLSISPKSKTYFRTLGQLFFNSVLLNGNKQLLVAILIIYRNNNFLCSVHGSQILKKKVGMRKEYKISKVRNEEDVPHF